MKDIKTEFLTNIRKSLYLSVLRSNQQIYDNTLDIPMPLCTSPITSSEDSLESLQLRIVKCPAPA